jgi:glycosyltransferase involved in cell wall biosynthesis
MGFPVRRFSRDEALARRLALSGAWLMRRAGHADVVYSSGMETRSALAALVGRIPLVVKVVSDPAYERARRTGAFAGSLAQFQEPSRDPRAVALKRARDWSIGTAARIVTPGGFLADLIVGWGIARDRIRVVPNPAVVTSSAEPRTMLRRRLGMTGPTAVFAGRFVAQKNVPLAVEALRHAPGLSLVLVGDGPERGAIEGTVAQYGLGRRVRFVGALPRADAVEWVRAADAAILPSDWEGFPHAAVEALAVGTPVVATSVGAIPEIITDGRNGALVPVGDAAAFGAALRLVACSNGPSEGLRAGALESGRQYLPACTYGAIEEEIRGAVLQSLGPSGSRRPSTASNSRSIESA